MLSAFALLLLTGRYLKEGPVGVAVTQNHGIHLGDLFVAAGWAAGMLALLVLTLAPMWQARRRSSGRGVDAVTARR